MSELRTFLFAGLPVRGALVRLTESWQELLRRRSSHPRWGAYPEPVQQLLGDMTAAAVLLQSIFRFEGALLLQLQGDGPVQLAVAEAHHDGRFRATAKVRGSVAEHADLTALVNPGGTGRCAITLDPQGCQPGQQAYQGVVPLVDAQGQPLRTMAQALQAYMAQSEQLDTTLVLASDAHAAAGLLVQRLPALGQANLAATHVASAVEDESMREDYRRIALLAASARRQELLQLDGEALLHRLFWQESLQLLEHRFGDDGPRFSCACSRERVAQVLRQLGAVEANAILAEQGHIEVGCDFCGVHHRFDAVDVAQLFDPSIQPMAHAPTAH